MRGTGACFRAELWDAVTRPLLWIGLVATGVAAWFAGSMTTIRTSGYVVFGTALEASSKAAAFFLIGIAAIAVAGERSRGTVRWILPRPISRTGFIIGKAASLAVIF